MKKILLWISMIVLLVGLQAAFVSAGFASCPVGQEPICSEGNTTRFFKGNSTSGTDIIDSMGRDSGVANSITESDFWLTKDWTNESSMTTDGSNDWIDADWGATTDTISYCDAWTMAFRVESADTSNVLIWGLDYGATGSATTNMIRRNGNSGVQIEISDGSGNERVYYWTNTWDGTCPDVACGEPQHIVVNRTSGCNPQVDLFINGVKQSRTAVSEDTLQDNNIAGDIAIGARRTGDASADSNWNGTFDEFMIFNRSLTFREIQTLNMSNYTRGEGGAPPPAATDTLNMTNVLPATETQYNYGLVRFNVTLNSSYDGNVSVYINASGKNKINATFDAGTNVLVAVNVTLPTGRYEWYLNATNNDSSEQTTNRTLYIDTTQPAIETNIQNKIVLINSNKNLTADINITDDLELWSLRINDTTSGTIFYKEDLNGTVYNYNLSWLVNNYTEGLHNITITARDGHTAEVIPEWRVNKVFGALKFDWQTRLFDEKYVKVSPQFGLADSFEAIKQTDRYIFKHKTGHSVLRYSVRSSHKIEIKESDLFNAWLIVPELDRWIDFNLKDATGEEQYQVQRVSPYEVYVIISNLDGRDTYEFESIGALNTNSITYQWHLSNATTTATAQLIENTTTPYILNITKSNGSVTSNADFFYNGARQSVTKTTNDFFDQYKVMQQHAIPSGDNETITYNWTYNVSYGTNLDEYSENGTSVVHVMKVQLCDNAPANETALNFTVFDANTGDPITQQYTYSANFDVWDINNTNYNRSYGFTNSSYNISNDVCIYPYFTTLRSTYDTLFSLTGYSNTHYIQNNDALNSTLQTIPINLVNSSVATTITTTIVDEYDNALSSYTIEAQQYDLATGNYTSMGVQYTDSNGQAQFSLDVSIYEYRFVVKNPSGATVHVEPKQKLIDTSYTFQVVLGTSPEFIAKKLYALDIVLSADRPNKNFTVTWNDINVHTSSLIFEVFKDNTTQNASQLYSVTTTANSGVDTYHITEETNNVSIQYIGRVYVISKDDGDKYLIDSKTMDFRKEWDLFGNESLIGVLMVVGTLAFIGAAINIWLAVIFPLVGLLLVWGLGLIAVSLFALVGLVIAGIVIIARVKAR